MNWGRLLRVWLRVLAALSILAAFVVLDWYPLVKDLGRLRRERSGWERKIKDYGAMSGNLDFPAADENSLWQQCETRFLQSLPLVESDGAWQAMARTELLQRERGMAHPIHFFAAADKTGREAPGLAAWLERQAREIRQGFQAAASGRRFPWHGLFAANPQARPLLASQPLGIALNAPLPELLALINRVSWGAGRLEIVRLRLEPDNGDARVWLACRGSYRVPGPSAWRVRDEAGMGEEKLLVDPDSPLLLREVDPLLAPPVEKRELPGNGSPW